LDNVTGIRKKKFKFVFGKGSKSAEPVLENTMSRLAVVDDNSNIKDKLNESLPIAPSVQKEISKVISEQSKKQVRSDASTQDLQDVFLENERQIGVVSEFQSQPTPNDSQDVTIDHAEEEENNSDADINDNEVSSQSSDKKEMVSIDSEETTSTPVRNDFNNIPPLK
jgi:hypothetical protein